MTMEIQKKIKAILDECIKAEAESIKVETHSLNGYVINQSIVGKDKAVRELINLFNFTPLICAVKEEQEPYE